MCNWDPQQQKKEKKTTLKKNKLKGITLSNFKTYYKAIVTKIVWYWDKDRYIDQWTRNKSPEINSHIYVFSTNRAETIGFLHANNEFGPLPHIIYKNQIKMD